MTTLLSKNEEKSIDLKMIGYTLEDGDRLLVGVKDELEKAEKFLNENGFGGLYFDPTDEVEIYKEYKIEAALYSNDHAIRFFN